MTFKGLIQPKPFYDSIIKTFYVLMNIAFDVRVHGLLNSMFCMQNRVNFLSSSGKLVFKCLLK